jgi:hypothetical protein
MPITKLQLKPGVNRENTRYTNEGGWYESDKVRFRQGTPEKIGGWARISQNTFIGVCRSLWNWVTLAGQNLLGIGTSSKFFIENGGAYFDITPIRETVTLGTNPFKTAYSTLSAAISVTDTSLTLVSATNFAIKGVINIGTEQIAYNGVVSNTLTNLTRGYNGTTVVAHASGDAVGSYTVTVTDSLGGFVNGDYVTFYPVGTFNLSSVAITGTAGQFSCSAASSTLLVGQPVVISGTFPSTGSGGGSITGYVDSTTYYIISTNGTTTFTLSNSYGGSAIVTTAGTTTGTTFGVIPIYGGIPIYGSYQLTYLTTSTYTILDAYPATSSTTGGTGTYAAYEVTTGSTTYSPSVGWGSGTWNTLPSGTWGIGNPVVIAPAGVRIWNQINWGQNLIYGPRNGPLYYWDAAIGYSNSAVTMTIANPCIITCNLVLVDNMPITFTTTGTLPNGGTDSIIPGKTYYVKLTGATTFKISVVSGSTTYINTTGGIQSGTQYISPKGTLLSSQYGASGTPLSQSTFTVSDASRFLIVFGTNEYGSLVVDPMLVRWGDQESLTTWAPSITNQAGFVRLSHGSKIVTTLQSRQEIVVWTDSSLYSFQYLGPPYVWGTQLLADNISIIGPNAAAMASGVSYWMGVDKFYKYDGRVQTLRCDLRQYIYENINLQESDQVFGSTNEGFNEVWWFYCSITGPSGTGTDNNPNTVVDRYVIYNYLEDTWYYGNMQRTAWLDTGLRNYPIAATYSYNIVQHENGVDDNETGTTLPILATITSSQYDIGDGNNFAFVYRMIPDLTFRGSTAGTTPQITMYLQGLNNSGSGITQSGNATVVNTGAAPSVINVDQFTGQVYIRIRGRQMQMQITSNTIGTQWQLGAPRIDIRPDGRR